MRPARSLAEQTLFLDERKRELGSRREGDAALRNSGRRRTSAKRALLAKLEELAREQEREVPFPSNR